MEILPCRVRDRAARRVAIAAVLVSCVCARALGQSADQPSDPSERNAQQPRDPIEGKWLGTAGFPQDRVEIGFEFKRDAQHALRAYLFQSLTNFYGLEWPGEVTRDGDKYALKELALAVKLHDDVLEGTYFPLGAPIALHRVDELPSETPVPDLPSGPGPKWQTKLGGAIYAPAALRDGCAYVGTTAGIFYAIKLADGSIVWGFTAGRALHGEALATDDALYFVCDTGYLYKLERKTGKETWRYDLGDARVPRVLAHPIFASAFGAEFDFDTKAPRPLLADGKLFVGSGDGGFHCIDAASGERVWRFEAKDKIRTNASIANDLVIFGSFDHRVYALDRTTGKEAWNRDVGAMLSSSPSIIGDKVITGNRGGLLASLDAATGKTAWRMLFWGSSVESDAVPYGDLFYIGSSDMRRVSCIDPGDAHVVWRTDVYGCAWGRAAVTEKSVFIGAIGFKPYQMRHLGGLAALDRESGKIQWRWPMPEWPGSLVNGFEAGPAIDHDLVVIGGLDGSLYAFSIA